MSQTMNIPDGTKILSFKIKRGEMGRESIHLWYGNWINGHKHEELDIVPHHLLETFAEKLLMAARGQQEKSEYCITFDADGDIPHKYNETVNMPPYISMSMTQSQVGLKMEEHGYEPEEGVSPLNHHTIVYRKMKKYAGQL